MNKTVIPSVQCHHLEIASWYLNVSPSFISPSALWQSACHLGSCHASNEQEHVESPRGFDMAIILTVIHFKYIVQAACAFTPIEAYKAAFATNCFCLFFWEGGEGPSLSINMCKYCIDLTRMKFWLDRLKAKHERLITNTRFSKPQRFKCMLPSCESVAHLQTVNQVYKGCWPTEGILFFISPLLSSNNTDYFPLYLIL